MFADGTGEHLRPDLLERWAPHHSSHNLSRVHWKWQQGNQLMQAWFSNQKWLLSTCWSEVKRAISQILTPFICSGCCKLAHVLQAIFTTYWQCFAAAYLLQISSLECNCCFPSRFNIWNDVDQNTQGKSPALSAYLLSANDESLFRCQQLSTSFCLLYSKNCDEILPVAAIYSQICGCNITKNYQGS